jgi:carbon-monoxide dehydrogenase small subunit
LTVQTAGSDVKSVEGMATADGLHVIQQAFVDEHGLQCGFCTPGMLMRAYRFLQENPDPNDEEIRWGMSGNLCRCTGYQNIINAVRTAAKNLQQA